MNYLVLISLLQVNYLFSSGRIIEGDIMVADDDEHVLRSIGEDKYKWPQGIVPYEISNVFSASDVKLMLEGMQLVTKKTGGCINFVEKNSSDPFWVKIIRNTGCWSYVGRITKFKGQRLSLGAGCLYLGTIVHELSHAIGFYHETNRPDRDDYITINTTNIISGLENLFEKRTGKNLFNTPYDYYSIMHYSSYAFAADERYKTIIPKNSNITLVPEYLKTEEQVLSDIDVIGIRTLYQCGLGTENSTTEPSTTTTEPSTTTTEPSTTTTESTTSTTEPSTTTTESTTTTTTTEASFSTEEPSSTPAPMTTITNPITTTPRTSTPTTTAASTTETSTKRKCHTKKIRNNCSCHSKTRKHRNCHNKY